MYFGIVPVFLVFLPYRLLTGHVPANYRVSQLFAGLYQKYYGVIARAGIFRQKKSPFSMSSKG